MCVRERERQTDRQRQRDRDRDRDRESLGHRISTRVAPARARGQEFGAPCLYSTVMVGSRGNFCVVVCVVWCVWCVVVYGASKTVGDRSKRAER